jgi:hypothetical protein
MRKLLSRGVTFLNKTKTKMRVKSTPLPKSMEMLGTMLDAMNLPEGHACCPKCAGYKFEVSGFPGAHKVELGCVNCGDRFYVAFPVDIEIPVGRYYCKKHPDKAMIMIHNIDVVSFGCEACRTEINIQLKKSNGLVLADG